jgi:CheY-like chemotaxis protein/HPt (histidine-containing phosphotransfer) domain-containing protein
MMAEVMGGSISVESEYGNGSLFTVKLPQKFVTDEIIGPDVVKNLKKFQYRARNRKPKLSRASLPYAHVLVVDDVQTNLDVALGMMKPYRMQVDCATSGQQAVDAVRGEKVRYNAVFMDHMMPGMDGIEATRIIREEIGTEYAKTVPIIAFTANAMTGSEDMFLSKGFNGFLSKPIDLVRLDEAIQQWVRDEELEKTFKDQPMANAGFNQRSGKDRRTGYDRRHLAGKLDELDIHKGMDRFGGDWETFVQILKSFAVNTKLVLQTINEVNKDNLPNYAITVHGIKGSCRGICAEAAGTQAEALEHAAKAGDIDFVLAHNAALIEAVSKLIAKLDDIFGEKENSLKKDKPKKDKPYAEALSRLRTGCEDYNIEEIETVMKEIEAFQYTADDGLALWLRGNVDQMNYMEIAEKLSQIAASGASAAGGANSVAEVLEAPK